MLLISSLDFPRITVNIHIFSMHSKLLPSSKTIVQFRCLRNHHPLFNITSWGDIMKHCRMGGLSNRNLFSQSLECGDPRSGCQNDWVLVRAFFLIFRRPAFHGSWYHMHTHTHTCTERDREERERERETEC